ncbi:hypothetical protein [Frankia sp. Cas3]|uniref:hypothetical protein n=1 Tax=Frankia sp. Cas3 TaxID=3073926 RepID=UPI002AD5A787|nr:hypothetical protein [Frankia sp. Cas3]
MAVLGCRVAWETGAMRDIARALPREGGQLAIDGRDDGMARGSLNEFDGGPAVAVIAGEVVGGTDSAAALLAAGVTWNATAFLFPVAGETVRD